MSSYHPIYTNSHALVIGIDDYDRPGFMPLGEAENDARRMAAALSAAPYNFAVDSLIGRAANRRAILGHLSALEDTDVDSRILFYFAGHGYVETSRYGHPTGYLAAHDTHPERRHTAIRLQEITDFTQYASAKHISFIFDNCYSATALGLVTKLRSNLAADRYLTSPVYQALAAGETVVDDARSMTGYILEFLAHGEVDPETGLLTMRQLADHVRDRMVMQTRSIQKPVLGYLPGSEGGEYVFLMETGPRLPYDLEMALRSENGYIRWGAVASLIDLARRDDLMAGLAIAHLEEMAAHDPDARVRGAAQSYFDELDALRLAEEERARQTQLAHQADEERARLAALEAQLEEARRKQAESEAALRQAEEAEQRRLEAIAAARKAREITPPGEFPRPVELEPEPQPIPPEAEPSPVPMVARPARRPAIKRKTVPWAWIGGIGAVIVIGIAGVVGLIALMNGGGEPSPTPEPAQTEESVAVAETTTPTDQPTPIPSTATPEPTRDPALVLAENGVSNNAEWTPVIQEFNGVEMALVPAGCFQMGSEEGYSDETPVHEACFEEPFWIDVYEVTNKAFGSVGCESTSSEPNQPRNCVNWSDSLAHCASRGARLPTEAEWEYAARGPDGLVYPWGNTFIADNVVYAENNPEGTASVGSKPSGVSWVGAYDLSGNVWEWINDWYDSDYYGTLADGVVNPQGPGTGDYRVLRGGSWYLSSNGVRAAIRDRFYPSGGYGSYGFRCARSYTP